jgi:hypothetical protein
MKNHIVESIKQEILDVFADEMNKTKDDLLKVVDGEGGLSVDEALKNGEMSEGMQLYKRVIEVFDKYNV